MKIFKVWLIAILVLVIACNKQDATVSEEQQEQVPVITNRSCASYDDVLQANLAADPGLRARM